jgi:hypothetical protein
MKKYSYSHQVEYLIQFAQGADERSPGGAITVELCGHWDHEGPCRWPHYTNIATCGDKHQVIIDFDASEDDFAVVKERIELALQKGQLIGPDGRLSVWEIVK